MLRGWRGRGGDSVSHTTAGVSFFFLSLREQYVCYLGAVKVVRLHVGRLVSLRLLGEGDRCAYKAAETKKTSVFHFILFIPYFSVWKKEKLIKINRNVPRSRIK